MYSGGGMKEVIHKKILKKTWKYHREQDFLRKYKYMSAQSIF